MSFDASTWAVISAFASGARDSAHERAGQIRDAMAGRVGRVVLLVAAVREAAEVAAIVEVQGRTIEGLVVDAWLMEERIARLTEMATDCATRLDELERACDREGR